MRVISIPIMRTWTRGSMSVPQHVVLAGRSTTILPPTPRPTGCLGSSVGRFSARRDTAYNQQYIKSNIEPNNAANNCWNNNWYDFANSLWYSDG